MKEYKYPNLKEHKEVHDKFIKKFYEFKMKFIISDRLGVEKIKVAEEPEGYIL